MKFLLVSFFLIVFINCFIIDAAAASVEGQYYPEKEDPVWIPYLTPGDEKDDVQGMRQKRATRASESDVAFYLFTLDNRVDADKIKANNFESIKGSHFNSSRKTKFIIHGLNNNKDNKQITSLKETFLDNHDVNVIVVDWSGPAHKFYTTAKGAVPVVGKIVEEFIIFVIEEFEASPKDFSLVGYSLGAHVAGCAGLTVKKKHGLIDHIIGLDPASPLFTCKNTKDRLDPTDALFVQVIHTNGRLLGFKSSIGHADYYPNGGLTQPGCGLVEVRGKCSHKRALKYYVESIRTSGFVAYQCDDFDAFKKGVCFNNSKSLMGGFDVDRKAKGDYFLKTSRTEPFALGDVSSGGN